MFDALVLAGLIAWKFGCLTGLSVVCQYFDKSDKLLTCGATTFKTKHADTVNSQGFCRFLFRQTCPFT